MIRFTFALVSLVGLTGAGLLLVICVKGLEALLGSLGLWLGLAIGWGGVLLLINRFFELAVALLIRLYGVGEVAAWRKVRVSGNSPLGRVIDHELSRRA